MSAQNGEKKLSMSLDDIIKMNRKQNQRTGGGGGGNNNNNRRNNNFAGGNNNNRRFNNNNRRQGGGGGGPRNNNNNNRPKFGMLNRSKTIGKNNRIGGGRPNNVGGGNRFNNGPKRQNNRPRFQNQGNRFNNRPQIQQQPQQQQQQPKPQQPRPQQPRQQNRAVGGGIANKLAQRIRQQRAGNKLGRVGGTASRGLARLNTFRSNKIAMQAARKNVQKAKRLLTTNRRNQQIKPRRFQNPGNPNAQNKVRLAGRRLPNKTANGDNRLNAIRKQIQRQKIQQRQQKIRTNRPILNRNRGNNRMVMG